MGGATAVAAAHGVDVMLGPLREGRSLVAYVFIVLQRNQKPPEISAWKLQDVGIIG